MISLVLVGCSIWRMSQQAQEQSLKDISISFLIVLGLHVIGFVLCICLPLLMAVIFDAGDRSLTYFTSNWLVLGLYICPAVIGLVIPLSLYYTWKPEVSIGNQVCSSFIFNNYLISRINSVIPIICN